MTKSETSSYLTPRQAADLTGGSLVQIYRLLGNGKLRARKLYGVWQISSEAIEELKRTHPLLGRR